MKKNTILNVLFICLLAFSFFGLKAEVAEAVGLNTVQDVHQLAVEKGFIALDENGEIKILEGIEKLSIESKLLFEYIESIHSANNLVKFGLVYFDENFIPLNVSTLQLEIAAKDSFTSFLEENGEPVISNESNRLHYADSYEATLPTPYANPTLNLTTLVKKNKNELDAVLLNFVKTQHLGGGDPYIATATYFYTKVKPRGAWDYKTVSGYSPATKTWTATTHTGTRTITSEYIGNYNYAYVGESLFSKSVLLAGGQFANGNIFKVEDEDDRTAIKNGFDDAVKYF